MGTSSQQQQQQQQWAFPFSFEQNVSSCSGHGKYNPQTQICECDAGWTGRSDFVNAEGVLCHINLTSITVLWVLNLVFTTLLVIKCVPKLSELMNKFLTIRRKMLEKGKSYSIRSNQGLLALIIYFGVCFPAHLVTGFLRIFAPMEERIGLAWPITIAWIITRTGFYSATSTYLPALLAQTLKAMNAAQSVIKYSFYISHAISTGAFAVCFFSFPILFNPTDMTLARACFVAFLISHISILTSYNLQARYLKKRIYAILTVTGENTHAELRDRLLLIQDATIKQTGSQSLIYLIFVCIPFLWVCHDYFLPISWIAMPIMGHQLTESLYENRSKESGATPASSKQNVGGSRKNKDDGEVPMQGPGNGDGALAVQGEDMPVPRAPPRRQSAETRPFSTVTSIMQVNEENPALLSTGKNWKGKKRSFLPFKKG